MTKADMFNPLDDAGVYAEVLAFGSSSGLSPEVAADVVSKLRLIHDGAEALAATLDEWTVLAQAMKNDGATTADLLKCPEVVALVDCIAQLREVARPALAFALSLDYRSHSSRIVLEAAKVIATAKQRIDAVLMEAPA